MPASALSALPQAPVEGTALHAGGSASILGDATSLPALQAGAPLPSLPSLGAPDLRPLEGLDVDRLNANLQGLGGLGSVGRNVQLDLPLQRLSLSAGVADAASPEGRVLAEPAVHVAAGVGLSAALALIARGLLSVPLLPFYSRIDGSDLMNHPTRRELVRIIGVEPGVNISDLHGRLDMGWGSLLYHLQRLEAQGLVVSHRWGRSRRYFMNQRAVEQRAPAIRVLKAANARALAERIAQAPGATQEELALGLNLSKSVVSKYAQRLEQAALVERQVGRNCLRLFPTAELRELLHTLPAPALRLPPADQPAEMPAAAHASAAPMPRVEVHAASAGTPVAAAPMQWPTGQA